MSKKTKTVLISVIAVVLVAALAVGGVLLSRSRQTKIPDLSLAADNTVNSLFGDWKDAAEWMKALFQEADGTKKPLSVQFESRVNGKDLDTRGNISIRFNSLNDFQGNADRFFALGNSDGVNYELTLTERGDNARLKIKTANGTYAEKSTAIFGISKDRTAEKFRASAWNPENNPESPMNEEMFDAIFSALDHQTDNTGEQMDFASFRTEYGKKLFELSQWETASAGGKYEGTNAQIITFRLGGEETSDFHDFTRTLIRKNTVLNGLMEGVNVFDSLYPVSSSAAKKLSEKQTTEEITVCIQDDRFAEIILIANGVYEDGQKFSAKLQFDFSYGETKNALRVTEIQSEENEEGAMKATARWECLYSVEKEGENRIFNLEASTKQTESNQSATVALHLKYEKDTGDFMLVPHLEQKELGSDAIPESISEGPIEPSFSAIDSSSVLVYGAVTKAENDVTLTVSSVRYPLEQTVFTVGTGVEVRTKEYIVHPTLTLTLQTADAPEEADVSADIFLESATAAQIKAVRCVELPERTEFLLNNALSPSFLMTSDGYICEPRETVEEKVNQNVQIYWTYLNSVGNMDLRVCFWDEELGLYFCTAYDKQENMMRWSISTELTDLIRKNFQITVLENGMLRLPENSD